MSKAKINNLVSAISSLRETIYQSVYLRNAIYQKKSDGSWDRLYAALDALEDSQVAIDDYQKLDKVMYLELYGLMQAFVVQQDAVNHVCSTTVGERIKWKEHRSLNDIRRLRNRTAGHPADIKEGKDIYFSNIDRSSITKDTFRYILWKSSGADFHNVNIKEIIEAQYQEILSIVSSTIRKIKESEKDFVSKFKGKNVKDVYGSVTGYHFEKIYGFTDLTIARSMHSSFCKVFQNVKRALEERYGSFETTINAPGLKETINDIEELLSRIGKSLEDGISDDFGHRIYVDSLQSSWSDLGQMVDETDERFSK